MRSRRRRGGIPGGGPEESEIRAKRNSDEDSGVSLVNLRMENAIILFVRRKICKLKQHWFNLAFESASIGVVVI